MATRCYILSQLETGFLAIFLCPLRPLGAFPACLPPPPLVIWAYRWLFFRVMLGAGLVSERNLTS